MMNRLDPLTPALSPIEVGYIRLRPLSCRTRKQRSSDGEGEQTAPHAQTDATTTCASRSAKAGTHILRVRYYLQAMPKAGHTAYGSPPSRERPCERSPSEIDV